MEFVALDMSDVARDVKFPFPVRSLGYGVSMEPRRHTHYQDRIEFCLRLSAEAERAVDYINGERRETTYPHFLVKAPNVEHVYDINDRRNAFYVIYSSDVVPALRAAGIPIEPYNFEVKLTSEIFDIIDRLKSLFERSRDHSIPEKIDLLCFALITSLSFARFKATGPESVGAKKARAIASYMQLHFREDLNIDSLIQGQGVSRRSFFRHWKRLYQNTPSRRLMELRLSESKRLLERGDLSVADVAESVNIDDANYFIRLFKREYGLTPYQYQKSLTRLENVIQP